MLFRLVAPVQRKDSRNQQFTKRIPADVRDRAIGTRLALPVGDTTKLVTITANTQSIRVSLETSDPATVKIRQAELAAYVEQVFAALRADKPVSLTNKQAHALAGRLYRSWAGGEGKERSMSVVLEDGEWVRDDGNDLPGEAEAVWEATAAYLDRHGSADTLEQPLGAIVDRLLIEWASSR